LWLEKPRLEEGIATMGIAERIYDVVKSLPEADAAAVLAFAERKRTDLAEKAAPERRAEGLRLLDKHSGRFKMVKLDRDELHDRDFKVVNKKEPGSE
jgi:hypothetical protein